MGKIRGNTLTEKGDIFSHLKVQGITDADYTHGKRVRKNWKIKNLAEWHELYVQSDTLMLVDEFTNFQNMLFETYGLDPAQFSSAPGLTWQAALKQTKVKLNVLTNIDMLLMVEKSDRGGIIMLFVDIWKLIKNTWKIMIRLKNHHILSIDT